jgi:hypothetical protein
LAFVGVGAHAQALQRLELRAATLTPYELMKYERSLAPTTFDRNYQAVVLRRLEQQGARAGSISSETVEVSDLSQTLRVHIDYSGSLDEATGGLAFRGFIRQYFHTGGVVVLEGNCLPVLSECSDLNLLLVAADRSLLLRLDDPTLEGVLPDGDCSEESEPLPALPTETASMATCMYEDGGLTLTFGRSDTSRFYPVMEASGKGSSEARLAIARAALREGTR